MKKIITVVVILLVAFFLYQYINKEKVVKVEGNLNVSQQSSFDPEAPNLAPLSYAQVEGTVKNEAEYDVKNIEIKYNVAGDTVVVNLALLKAGEEKKFKTEVVKTPSKTPAHKFLEVTYEEAN